MKVLPLMLIIFIGFLWLGPIGAALGVLLYYVMSETVLSKTPKKK